MAIPVFPDASDWNIAEDEVTYPECAIRDACERAVRWRQQCALSARRVHQGADDRITYEINPILTPDLQGWVTLGWVIDPWITGKLRIFWHPESDRVQVDRPPQLRQIVTPKVKPAPPPDRTYAVTIQVRDDRVTLRARRSIGAPYGGSALKLTIPVPVPDDASRRDWFLSMMNFAESGIHYVTVPPDFPTWTGQQRRQFFVDYAMELAERAAKPRRR